MTLLLLTVLLSLSRFLPPICTPLIALGCAAVLYKTIYKFYQGDKSVCVLIPYSMFVCVVVYAVVSILMNLFEIWHIVELSPEFVFFNKPFIPSLILNPVCFVCLGIMYLRRRRLKVCIECRLAGGASASQGRMGNLICSESTFQLRNLMLLFGGLTAAVWVYYLLFYIKINANARDWYVFTWLNVIAYIGAELYFIFRYFNLYLDFKENNEIISEEEMEDLGAQTYVRYYLVCENNMYVDVHSVENFALKLEVIDTPFQTRRAVNGMTMAELKQIITQMTGISDGELRFFYGRKHPALPKLSLLRYFYFVEPQSDGEMPEVRTKGEWMNYDTFQRIYSQETSKMSRLLVADNTRLATIILTEKIFDENGFRKTHLRSYSPTYNLKDVRHSSLDFQDDKWIRISLFNSDTPFYRFKRWMRKMMRRGAIYER